MIAAGEGREAEAASHCSMTDRIARCGIRSYTLCQARRYSPRWG